MQPWECSEAPGCMRVLGYTEAVGCRQAWVNIEALGCMLALEYRLV